MTNQPGTTLAEAIRAAQAALVEHANRLTAGVPDDELIDVVTAAADLSSAITAVVAPVLVELDTRETPKKILHWGGTADWLAHTAGLRKGDAKKAVLRAHQLVEERTVTLDALCAGAVSSTQAAVICDAVDKLPTAPALRREAEAVLLAEAKTLDATQLTTAGHHVLEVVDPDSVERKLEASLDKDERAAHRNRDLWVKFDRQGGFRFGGNGSAEDGALLRTVLMAKSAPSPAVDPDGCGEEIRDPRDHGARMFDAMVDLAQHALDTDAVPHAHGAPTRVVVTVNEPELTHPHQGGTTEDGTPVAVATIRRLACDAEIITLRLDAHGCPLSMGRDARTITFAQWTALVTRDRHCTFPGCTRPPVMGQAHHIVHWIDGGVSDLDNYALLCGEHHRVIHHTPWRIRMATDGRPEFLPPPRRGTTCGGTDETPEVWVRTRPRRE